MAKQYILVSAAILGLLFFEQAWPETPVHENSKPALEPQKPVYNTPEPVYKTKKVYIQPENQEGKACVEECRKTAKVCVADCKQAYERCYRYAPELTSKNISRARRKYKDQLAVYNEEIKAYDYERNKVERYRRGLQKQWRRYNERCTNVFDTPNACDRKRDIEWKLKDFELEYSEFLRKEPKRPAKPNLPSEESLIQAIRNKVCKKDCGCRDQFERCFTPCGGRIETKKICVENCESE